MRATDLFFVCSKVTFYKNNDSEKSIEFTKVLRGPISYLESDGRLIFRVNNKSYDSLYKALTATGSRWRLNPYDSSMIIPIGTSNVRYLWEYLEKYEKSHYLRLKKPFLEDPGSSKLYVYDSGFYSNPILPEKSIPGTIEKETSPKKIYQAFCKFGINCTRVGCYFNHPSSKLCAFDTDGKKRCTGKCLQTRVGSKTFNHYDGFSEIIRAKECPKALKSDVFSESRSKVDSVFEGFTKLDEDEKEKVLARLLGTRERVEEELTLGNVKLPSSVRDLFDT